MVLPSPVVLAMSIFSLDKSRDFWEKAFVSTGLLGPLIAFVSISIAVTYSPWFSWSRNALSDLGHSLESSAAPVFNLGLAFSGTLIVIYSVTSLYKKTKSSWFILAMTGFFLILVAVFDEAYGRIHFLVSLLFFLTGTFGCLVFYAEKKSPLALIGFLISTGVWITYFYLPRIIEVEVRVGIAVPEFISSIAISAWIMWESIEDLMEH